MPSTRAHETKQSLTSINSNLNGIGMLFIYKLTDYSCVDEEERPIECTVKNRDQTFIEPIFLKFR